jgi:SAM-dependent methyltransferase
MMRWVVDFRERIAPEELGTGVAGAEHLARYLFACHFAASRRVVDLCSGTGYGANLLLAAGAKAVIGIELDENTVREAQERYPQVRFDVADVTAPLNLDADLYVCFEGLEHVENPDGLLRNMTGGTAIISTPNGATPSGSPYHVREYTLEEFRAMLDRNFETVRMYFQWLGGDPFDTEWGWRAIAKAFVPVKLKSQLRPPPPDGGPTATHLAAFPHKPLPLSYPLPPGLRYETPTNWIAVCR